MPTLTRYLTRLFVARFLLVLVCAVAFVIGLDLMANSDEVMVSRDGNAAALLTYVALRLPEIVSEFIKIACLLAALLTLIHLIRNSELTAIWNTGVSQFGVIGRLVPITLLIGAVQFATDDRIIPKTSEALRIWGVGNQDGGRSRNTIAPRDATWIHVGDAIVRVPIGNIDDGRLSGVTIFERDAEGHMLARIDVAEARYINGTWRLTDITRRQIPENSITWEAERDWKAELDLDTLKHLTTHPRNLSFAEVTRFATGNERGPWAPHHYKTWQQVKLAAFFTPLLMLMLVVALAQRFQRTGHVEFLFIGGISLGFCFFIFNGVSLAMGEVGLLPPLLASWAPLGIFLAIAGSVAFWHETHKKPTAKSEP